MTRKVWGQQDIWIAHRSVGTVRVLSMHAVGTLAPRVHILLGWTTSEMGPDQVGSTPLKSYRLRGLTGEVRLSEYADVVGTVQWIDPQQAAHSSSHPHEWQVNVTLELDRRKIELIDRHRKGGDAKLYLQLWPVFISSEYGWYDTEVRSFPFDVPRDSWLAIRTGLDGGRFLVLEVPLTAANSDAFAQAAQHLERALTHLHQGNYTDAIGACRVVVEAMFGVLAVPDKKSFGAYLEPKVGKLRAAQYANILGALKDLMKMPHHLATDWPEFTRAEAVFVVQSMQHLLALVGELVTTT